jgi:hypothetical protein
MGSIHTAEIDPEADGVSAIVPAIPDHDLTAGGDRTVHERADVPAHHIEEIDADLASAARDIESNLGSIAERVGSPQVQRESFGKRKLSGLGGSRTGNPES